MDKYVIAFDESDALNSVAVWHGQPTVRDALRSQIFGQEIPAREALAALIERAAGEGACEPGHECGRCVNWPPKVWHVQLSITQF